MSLKEKLNSAREYLTTFRVSNGEGKNINPVARLGISPYLIMGGVAITQFLGQEGYMAEVYQQSGSLLITAGVTLMGSCIIDANEILTNRAREDAKRNYTLGLLKKMNEAGVTLKSSSQKN